MSPLQALLLGAVQGITEFLPVSSDGHLVAVDLFLGSPLEGRSALGFDVLLHAGSLLALLLVYRATWAALCAGAVRGERDALRTIGLLLLATVPGALAGMFLEDAVAGMRSFAAAGAGFLVTGAVLVLGERVSSRLSKDDAPVRARTALLVGMAQAVAILPGVSRSGLTTTAGMMLNLPRARALDFSFLLAVPIIAGAVGKTLLDAFTGAVAFPAPLPSAAGLLSSFLVSIGAILFLRLFVARRSLALFAWYLVPAGLLLLSVSVRGN